MRHFRFAYFRGYQFSPSLNLANAVDGVFHGPAQFSTYHIPANRLKMLRLDDWESRKIPIVAAWNRNRTLSPLANHLIETSKICLAERT